MSSAPAKPNLEETHSEVDVSSAGRSETMHPEYYVDDSLRNAPDGSLYHTGASAGNYNASSASQEEMKAESLEVSHGNQYSFPSSAPGGYALDEAQHFAATFNQTNSQNQNLAQLSNVMHSYSNSLPCTLLASNVRPARESERQYSQNFYHSQAVVEAFDFICTFQFWRMAFLWNFSLIFSYLSLFFRQFKCYSRCSPRDSTFITTAVPMPVCIITGATSGLGATAAYDLSKEGFYVVLVGRSSKLLAKAISDIEKRNSEACVKAFEVNLCSFKSILEFKHLLQQWLRDSNLHSSVQLLINNAGILATSRRFTSEGYDQMLATNYIGAFCLTKVLLPLLENSPVPSRVVNVTSFTHRNVCCMQVDRETVSGKCLVKSKCYPYAKIYEYSKLCMLLFSYELHRQVSLMEKSHHISVVAADPGVVKTNIMREIPWCISQIAYIGLKYLGLLQSSVTGVCSIVDAALVSPEISGVYFFGGNGRILKSSKLSYDAKLAEDLWATSCNLFQELQLACQ